MINLEALFQEHYKKMHQEDPEKHQVAVVLKEQIEPMGEVQNPHTHLEALWPNHILKNAKNMLMYIITQGGAVLEPERFAQGAALAPSIRPTSLRP